MDVQHGMEREREVHTGHGMAAKDVVAKDVVALKGKRVQDPGQSRGKEKGYKQGRSGG